MKQQKTMILVVDDAPNIRRAFCQTLELSGYRTMEASSGEDALRKLENEDVNLTLMDVVMPGMSGIEAARRIKSMHGKHSVILMSGHVSVLADVDHACGVYEILEKPISVDRLLEAVQREISCDGEEAGERNE